MFMNAHLSSQAMSRSHMTQTTDRMRLLAHEVVSEAFARDALEKRETLGRRILRSEQRYYEKVRAKFVRDYGHAPGSWRDGDPITLGHYVVELDAERSDGARGRIHVWTLRAQPSRHGWDLFAMLVPASGEDADQGAMVLPLAMAPSHVREQVIGDVDFIKKIAEGISTHHLGQLEAAGLDAQTEVSDSH